MKTLPLALAVMVLAAAAGSARADEPYAAEASAPALARPIDRFKTMWRFEIGYRGTFVREATFDPFSTQDYFAQVSLGGSRTVYSRGRFSFAPGFAWDYGKAGATARGDATSLEVHRLLVPLEGRIHFGPWGYAFARAAPGVGVVTAEVNDPALPNAPLTKNRWLFAGDLSAGYAFPIWPHDNPPVLMPRVWVQTDWGYGWMGSMGLNLAADLPTSMDPRIASGVDLGALTMRGAFFRAAAAVSF
jgi:hypothetical protein